MQKLLVIVKTIMYIVVVLFVPISIIGVMLHLLDIFVSDTVMMMLYLITPVYMAVAGTWIIRKCRITTFLAKIGVIILSGIAAVYGFDVTYLAGGFYMLPLLFTMRASSLLAWTIMAGLWFILLITYVVLLVGKWIIRLYRRLD